MMNNLEMSDGEMSTMNRPLHGAVEIDTENQTYQLAKDLFSELQERLPAGGVICLVGDLGAGKTTFTRGFLRAAGYQGAVRSPTYTIVERYPTEPLAICHYDLYRLSDPEELEYIGLRDDLDSQNWCFIEWPERAGTAMIDPDLVIKIRINYIKKRSQVTKITRQINFQWHNRHYD